MTAHLPVFQAVDQYVKDYFTKEARLEFVETEIIKRQNEIETLRPFVTLLEEVRVFLQKLAEEARTQVTSGLEQIVTLALQLTFGPEYSFEIEVDISRNNPAIEFWICKQLRNGKVLKTLPEDSNGGGVVDAVAAGLRFGLLRVVDPYPLGPMKLDEPAKMVSADRIDSIAMLFKQLSRIFGKQILMVTHHTGLVDIVDQVYYVYNEDGVSVVSDTPRAHRHYDDDIAAMNEAAATNES